MERNLTRTRRCFLRARAIPFSRADGPIALENGETFQASMDDGPIPAERDIPLALPPPIGRIHNVAGQNQRAPADDAAPNIQTPKRKGAPLVSPSSQGARASRDTDDFPGGDSHDQFGAPAWKDETVLLDVAQDD